MKSGTLYQQTSNWIKSII